MYDLLRGAGLFYLQGLDDDDGHPQELVDASDQFLQDAKDYADIISVMDEPLERRRYQRDLSGLLRELHAQGLVAFARRDPTWVTGGATPDARLPTLHLEVVLAADERIYVRDGAEAQSPKPPGGGGDHEGTDPTSPGPG